MLCECITLRINPMHYHYTTHLTSFGCGDTRKRRPRFSGYHLFLWHCSRSCTSCYTIRYDIRNSFTWTRTGVHWWVNREGVCGISNIYETRQLEIADPRAILRTFDVMTLCSSWQHGWRHCVLCYHIWSRLAMVNNPLIHSGVQIRIPISLDEDRAKCILLLV